MKITPTREQERFLGYVFPFLFDPAAKLWEDAMGKVKPEKREQVEGLADIGFPTLFVHLDPEWKIPGPAHLTIVVEPTQAGEENKILEVGTTAIEDDYRAPLLDVCRLALGDLEKRETSMLQMHHAGEVFYQFAVDLKRQRCRLSASIAAAPKAHLGILEFGPPAKPSVVH